MGYLALTPALVARRSFALALVAAGLVLTPAIAAPGGPSATAQTPEETPTATATADPTVTATPEPSATPTAEPSVTPTAEPSVTPTASATASAEPTAAAPSDVPTTTPDTGATAGFVLSQPAPAPGLPKTAATGHPVATVVVRIAGVVTKRGTRVRVLSVRAPLGASIIARCSGSCPKRAVRARTSRRTIRLHAFERLLRPRTVLVMRVRVHGMTGRYTRLQMRRGKPPARRDACLSPAGARPVAC